MVDVGSFLPADVARTPEQTAVTPDEAVREHVRPAVSPVRVALGKPGTGMRHDLRARTPVIGSERFDFCRQLLRADLLQLQHISQLARSSTARHRIEPPELFDPAGVNGAADIAGFDQP